MGYKNFYFSFPTTIFFGKDSIYGTEQFLEKCKTVVLIYSSDFIKDIGIYSTIEKILVKYDISFIEVNDCNPNPKIDYLMDIAGRITEIDYILAIGGGSVIDTAKSLSLYLENKEDFVNKLVNNQLLNAKIPIGVVSTMPASGSEVNTSFVLNVGRRYGKIARANNSVRPVFAILDPQYLRSIDQFRLKCSISDILSHLLEQYFVKEENTYFIDEQIFANIRTLLKIKKIILSDEQFNNETVFEDLMLLASHSLSYVLSLGRTADWNVHSIEHAISSQIDTAHGAAISILYPAYLKVVVRNEAYSRRLIKLGKDIFGMNIEDPAAVVSELTDLFKSLDLPSSFMDLAGEGIDYENLCEVLFVNSSMIGRVFKVDKDTLKEIVIEL